MKHSNRTVRLSIHDPWPSAGHPIRWETADHLGHAEPQCDAASDGVPALRPSAGQLGRLLALLRRPLDVHPLPPGRHLQDGPAHRPAGRRRSTTSVHVAYQSRSHSIALFLAGWLGKTRTEGMQREHRPWNRPDHVYKKDVLVMISDIR